MHAVVDEHVAADHLLAGSDDHPVRREEGKVAEQVAADLLRHGIKVSGGHNEDLVSRVHQAPQRVRCAGHGVHGVPKAAPRRDGVDLFPAQPRERRRNVPVCDVFIRHCAAVGFVCVPHPRLQQLLDGVVHIHKDRHSVFSPPCAFPVKIIADFRRLCQPENLLLKNCLKTL